MSPGRKHVLAAPTRFPPHNKGSIMRSTDATHYSRRHDTFALTMILAAGALLGCSEPPPGPAPSTVPKDGPVGLSISPPVLSIAVGDEGRLTARAFDAKDQTINASIEWSSADPAIATVRWRDGTVTAIAAGTTTVTATAGALSATASVSVRPSDPVYVGISSSALTLIAGNAKGKAPNEHNSPKKKPTKELKTRN